MEAPLRFAYSSKSAHCIFRADQQDDDTMHFCQNHRRPQVRCVCRSSLSAFNQLVTLLLEDSIVTPKYKRDTRLLRPHSESPARTFSSRQPNVVRLFPSNTQTVRSK